MEITPNSCRICLKQEENEAFYEINQVNLNEELSVHFVLTAVLNLKISEADLQEKVVPSKICLKCCDNLVGCVKFLSQALESETLIENWLKQKELSKSQNEGKEEHETDVGLPMNEEYIEDESLEEIVPHAISENLEVKEGSATTNSKMKAWTSSNFLNAQKNHQEFSPEIHPNEYIPCNKCSRKFIGHNNSSIASSKRASTKTKTDLKQMFKVIKPTDRNRMVDLEHNYSLRPFFCSVCNKNFSTKESFILHECHKNKNRPKPLRYYECKFCLKTYSNQRKLSSHISAYHFGQKVDKRLFLEMKEIHQICEKVSKNEADKFSCPICCSALSSKEYLKNHLMRIHYKLKPFQCKFCEKTFTTAVQLYVHQNVHSKGISKDESKIKSRENIELERILNNIGSTLESDLEISDSESDDEKMEE